MGETRVVAVEGHDGAGKSSVARILADRLNARYVRPFGPPVGAQLSALRDVGAFDEMLTVARRAIHDAVSTAAAPRVVSDRHWVTVLTMAALRVGDLTSDWFPLPDTVVLWTDVQTTRRRHLQRGESPSALDRDVRYCAAFRRVSRELGLPLLDTTHRTPAETADEVAAVLGLAHRPYALP